MRSDVAWAVGLSAVVLAAVGGGIWLASSPFEDGSSSGYASDGAVATTAQDAGGTDVARDGRRQAAPSRTPRSEVGEPARAPGQRSVERDSRPAFDELLGHLAVWDAATAKERGLAGRRVSRLVEGLELTGLETFTLDDETHDIAVYAESKTGLEFVLVPAGSFLMGVPRSDEWATDADTAHVVTLTKAFLISRTEVTVDAWNRIMTDAKRPGRGGSPKPSPGQGAGDRPVVRVSWNVATAFCERAGMLLPTEAQWEYACRAGTNTRFYSGDTEDDLARIAWCKQNADGRSHAVAQRPPNAFGLYDTHGNVLEWCRDGYAPFDEEAATDPTGAIGSLLRLIRGGSFEHSGQSSTAGNRHRQGPQGTFHHVGFRPVIEFP